MTLQVLRTRSAEGSVSVDWEIRGLRGLLPQEGFLTYRGSLTFLPVNFLWYLNSSPSHDALRLMLLSDFCGAECYLMLVIDIPIYRKLTPSVSC